MSKILFESGKHSDATRVARLHSHSWQMAYRGILSDVYLDDQVLEDRLAVWTARMAEADDSLYLQLATDGKELVGFVCAMLDHDAQWGTLIDNLHVLPEMQGHGLGRRLMQHAAKWVSELRPHAPMYLWVYRANKSARAFYEKIGGMAVEQRSEQQPDGREAEIVRYVWHQPTHLFEQP